MPLNFLCCTAEIDLFTLACANFSLPNIWPLTWDPHFRSPLLRDSVCPYATFCFHSVWKVVHPLRHRDGHPGNAYSQKTTVCVLSTSSDHSCHRSFLWWMAFGAHVSRNTQEPPQMLCHIIPERTVIVSPCHKNNTNLTTVLRGNDIICLLTSQARLRRGRWNVSSRVDLFWVC